MKIFLRLLSSARFRKRPLGYLRWKEVAFMARFLVDVAVIIVGGVISGLILKLFF
jgi:hypothetical protein